MKRVHVLLISLIYCFSSDAQDLWHKVNSNLNYSENDVAIGPKGELIVNMLNKSYVYLSDDDGENWRNVANNDRYRFTAGGKYVFKDNSGNLYYNLNKTCFRYGIDEFNVDTLLKPESNTAQLKYSLNGDLFYVDFWMIFSGNKDMSKNPNDIVFSSKDFIIGSYFYDDDKNFIVTQNSKGDSTVIWLLNTVTKEKAIYSQFYKYIDKNTHYIDQEGNVFFTVDRNFYLAKFDKPFDYELINMNPDLQGKSIHRVGLISDGSLYIITDDGIYMNINHSFTQWVKLWSLSSGLPSVFEKLIIFDSLTAMNSVYQECETFAYFHSKKFNQWRKIELNLDLNNFNDLQKDRNNNLYAYKCLNRSRWDYHYYISEDNGSNWQKLIINGYPATSLGINSTGDALAVAGNRLHIFNSSLNQWEMVISSITNIPNIIFTYFHSSQKELFLEAYVDNTGSKDTEYLFNSSDGGKTWRTIRNFPNFGSLINYSGIDILVLQDNSKWIAYGLTVNSAFMSVDKGKTWVPDPLFVNSYSIDKLFELPDKRLIFSGPYYNVNGVYISNLNDQFELIHPIFNKLAMYFTFKPPSYIFGIYYGKPYFSRDLGKTYEISESGLPSSVVDPRIYLSNLIDSKNNLYLSIRDDGLYTTRYNVFTSIKTEQANTENIKISVATNQINIDCVNCKLQGIEFKIINSMGQEVESGRLYEDHATISPTNLNSGIYYFNIIDLNHKSISKKFLYIMN
ncbi:MAG: hypothetical protein WBB26_06410 [Saprospiraceae bacterium]